MDARNFPFFVPVVETPGPTEQRPAFNGFAAEVTASGGNQHRQILAKLVVRGVGFFVHRITQSVQATGTMSVRACAVSPIP